jgi:DNA polymerase-1
MIEAFKLGGDFHSRTALGMFDYIGEAIKKGECLLEAGDDGDPEHKVPLLKDKFAAERRKAKVGLGL